MGDFFFRDLKCWEPKEKIRSTLDDPNPPSRARAIALCRNPINLLLSFLFIFIFYFKPFLSVSFFLLSSIVLCCCFFFRCRVEQEIPNEEKRWTGDEIWFWIAARYRRPFLSLSGWNTGGLYQHSRQVFWLGVRSVAARLIIRSIANSKAAAYFIVIFIDPFSPSLKYVSTGANYQACSSTHITTPTNAKSMLFLITTSCYDFRVF